MVELNKILRKIGETLAKEKDATFIKPQVNWDTKTVTFDMLTPDDFLMHTITFEKFFSDYGIRIEEYHKKGNRVIISIPEEKLAQVMNILAEEHISPAVKLFENPANLEELINPNDCVYVGRYSYEDVRYWINEYGPEISNSDKEILAAMIAGELEEELSNTNLDELLMEIAWGMMSRICKKYEGLFL